MMDQYMYKNAVVSSKIDKIADMIKNAGIFQMLGFNMLSMAAGAADSTTAILRDGLVGRYFDLMDLGKSIAYNIPAILLHIKNFGNPVPNTKIDAFNVMLGIHKSTAQIAHQLSDNKIKQLLT